MNIQNLSVSHHGRNISGNAYLPDKEIYPAVIFSHGFNGSGDNFRNHAEILAQNGIGAFLYDFCGGSLNSRSDMSTEEMTVFTEKEDLSAMLGMVKTLETVDKNNIFLFGASMGGLVTALTAEENEADIRGIMLLFPALCVADDWNTHFKNAGDIPDTYNLWNVPLGRRFFETLRGFDVFEHIGGYKKNVLIMHGDKDAVVPAEYSSRANELYKNSKLEIFPGEGHGFSSGADKLMTDMVLSFVKNLY